MFSIGKKVTFEIGGGKAEGKILGWKLKDNVGYVLSDFLSRDSSPLKGGASAVMSMENKGTIFRVVVIYIDSLPKTGLLFVLKGNEDNTIFMKSLRQDERFRCLIPLSISGEKNGKYLITDISQNGISFQTRQPPAVPADNSLTVSFNAGGLGSISDLQIGILRSKQEADLHVYSARFVGTSEENKKALALYADMCRKWNVQ